MFWARIDNRLVHGQVIETWIPFTGARVMVVVNDNLANDVVQQEIMSLAIPNGVRPYFVAVEDVAEFLRGLSRSVGRSETFVLFATCRDAWRAMDKGLRFSSINVGNLHYGPGKKQILAHVALSTEDERCLRDFVQQGIELDFRCIPSESVQVKVPW